MYFNKFQDHTNQRSLSRIILYSQSKEMSRSLIKISAIIFNKSIMKEMKKSKFKNINNNIIQVRQSKKPNLPSLKANLIIISYIILYLNLQLTKLTINWLVLQCLQSQYQEKRKQEKKLALFLRKNIYSKNNQLTQLIFSIS